jgi:hypothetical protein
MERSNCSAVFPNRRGEEDDFSVVSDTSSLGNMLQIPQLFLNRKSSTKPTAFTSHPSSSPNSRLRGEANMQRLVVMAKHPQLEPEYDTPPPPPPPARIYKIVTQSPSLSCPRANNSTPDLASPPPRTTSRSKNKLMLFRRRSKSQWSAAAGSFSEAIQEMEPAVTASSLSSRRRKSSWGKRHQQSSRVSSSDDDHSDDDEERSWRWRIPGFHSSKSTMVCI